jgi:hypothetical protein
VHESHSDFNTRLFPEHFVAVPFNAPEPESQSIAATMKYAGSISGMFSSIISLNFCNFHQTFLTVFTFYNNGCA